MFINRQKTGLGVIIAAGLAVGGFAAVAVGGFTAEAADEPASRSPYD